MSPQPGPLSGVVVADFTRILAGPYATMLLADMGATVIKVEGPGGDDSRQWIPPHREGMSTYFMAVNRNKHSIVLDLKDPRDLRTAHRLIERADIFMENFKPGGLGRFGLDPQSVAERWPQLIHASITGFGSGAGRELPGYDLLVQGISGLMSVTGSAEGEPQRAGVAMFDVITGLHAAMGVLGALHERSASGQGQHLELDLLSSALSGLVNQTAGYAACGNVPRRLGNEHPSLFPYGPFPASDTSIIVCAGNDSQFERLMEALALPEAAESPLFASMEARNRNREALRALMVDRLSTRTAEEWAEILRRRGIPSAPILGIDGGVEFARTLGLEPVVATGSDADAVPTVKHPVTYSRTPASYAKAPPALGSDRDSVLAWLEDPDPRHAPVPEPALSKAR